METKDGKYLYVIDSGSGASVYDVSDPTQIIHINSFSGRWINRIEKIDIHLDLYHSSIVVIIKDN